MSAHQADKQVGHTPGKPVGVTARDYALRQIAAEQLSALTRARSYIAQAPDVHGHGARAALLGIIDAAIAKAWQ